MSNIYDVGVSLTLHNNVSAALAVISRDMLGMHGTVQQLQRGFNSLQVGIVGAFAGLTGGAILHAMGGLIDKGNALVKVQRDMAQAGATATEVQESYAKAWELTAKNTNMSAVEIMKMINDARQTFGDQKTATHHIDPFVRSASFLKAFEGNEKGGAHSSALMAEMNAAMKSGEIAGKVTPGDMEKHVQMLTAMKVAFGEQLKIGAYLNAQRTAGVSLRNADDRFRYGMFPALTQEKGAGAGVMLMTAFNKIVAGTGNRTKSLEHMASLGLVNPHMIEYAKSGHVKGLSDPDAIRENQAAAMNFASWVQNTFKPLLDDKLKGYHGLSKSVRESQLISSMFPDRKAADAVTMMLQQFTKLGKDADNIFKVHTDFEKYNEGSWDYQVQSFTTQWNNLLDALGAPMVATATEMLGGINRAMVGMAQWAASHPDAVRAIGGVLAGIGAGLAVIGTALVGGAILSVVSGLGAVAAGIAGIAAAAMAAAVVFGPTLSNIKAFFTGFYDGFVNMVAPLKDSLLTPLSNVFGSLFSIVSKLINPLGDMHNSFRSLGEVIGAMAGLPIRIIGETLGFLVQKIDALLTPLNSLSDVISSLGGVVDRVVGMIRDAVGSLWGGASPTAYRGAPLPPSGQQASFRIENRVILDGRQIAKSVSEQLAHAATYMPSVGGQDTRGSWLSPGATVNG